MRLITTTPSHRNMIRESRQNINLESFEQRFEPVHAAGIGFFGVVFYALIKSDFLLEKSRLKSDTLRYDGTSGLQKIKAVKICNPLCPSGVKASASYLDKEIRAIRQIWSCMEEPFQHNFAKFYEYNTSDTPWYSMEPVLSGLTLESLYKTTQFKHQPLPEDLTFHLIDHITKACNFLHTKCGIVRADVNRENLMLRYPGREAPLMPDLVMIDWSLWEEASDELMLKDTADIYQAISPVFFEGGWLCGAHHERDTCAVTNTTHSQEWLDLYDIISTKKCSMQSLGEKVASLANESRQQVLVYSEAANVIGDLLAAGKSSLTEVDFIEALAKT
jgi:serine/threonine protein kinase